MHLRIASTVSVCLGVVGLVGCGAEPAEPQAAAPVESRPVDAPRAGDGIDTAERYFLHTKAGFFPQVNLATLTWVHGRYDEDFIARPGAGLGRMDIGPPPLPTHWVELAPESQGDRNPESGRAGDAPVQYDAVTETLTLRDGTSHTVRERVWRLKDRKLMSVTAESGPAVYSNVPIARNPFYNLHDQMKRARESKPTTGATAPKRPLDAFETAGLAKLRAGQEAVSRVSGTEMRVLGAIRARAECLSCHKVDVGTMLGAFTYTLELQSEETPEADRLSDTAGLTDQELGAVQFIESRGGKVIRAPGGPVTELRLTFARNQENKNRLGGISTRVRLHDSALAVVGAFPELRVLDVSDSFVSDAGLEMIAELKQLKKLDLTGTVVSDNGVAALKKSLPECEIVRLPHNPIVPAASLVIRP